MRQGKLLLRWLAVLLALGLVAAACGDDDEGLDAPASTAPVTAEPDDPEIPDEPQPEVTEPPEPELQAIKPPEPEIDEPNEPDPNESDEPQPEVTDDNVHEGALAGVCEPWTLSGSGSLTAEPARVTLRPYLWVAHATVQGNDSGTGNAAPFSVSLAPAMNDGGSVVEVVTEESVTEGHWWHEFGPAEQTAYEVRVSAAGGGSWDLRITIVGNVKEELRDKMC